MRLALLFAPVDTGSYSTSARVEGVAWLREALARAGFRVVVVSDAETAETRLDDALTRVGADDAVLVHIAGRLSDGAFLRLDAERSIALRAIAGALAARAPASLAFIAELAYEGSTHDALVAADLEATRDAFDVEAHGASALVALQPLSPDGDPIPFSRLLLEAADAAAVRGPVFLSDAYEVARQRGGHHRGQRHVLARGGEEFELAEAREARSERRVAMESEASIDVVLPPAAESAIDASASIQAGPAIETTVPPAAVHVAPEMTSDDDPRNVNVDALIALADDAQGREAWDQALAGYRAALHFAPADALQSREAIRARLAAVRIEIASGAGDWGRVVDLRRKRTLLLADASERADELFALARTLVEKMRDVRGAVTELERARAIDPTRHDVLEALRRSYRVLARWVDLLEVGDGLIGITASLPERARLSLAQARVAIERAEDDGRGEAYLQAAIKDDPSLEEARVLLAALRGEPSDAGTPTRPAPDGASARSAARSTTEVMPVASEDAARLSRSGVKFRQPLELDSRVIHADALLAAGDEEGAIAELETAAVQTPWDVAAYERLHAVHALAGRMDRAYLAALALEELGALDDESHGTLFRWRDERALRARSPLDTVAWRTMRAPGCDDVVEGIFAAIGRAALAASLDERREKKRLVTIDPSRKQSETSTASIVRCFHWASQVLGVQPSELYVLDDVPGDIAAVPTTTRATAIGPRVLSGISMKELAFLTGRHVTYQRIEHQVLVYFPTLNDLTVLLLAAVRLVSPSLPVPTAMSQQVAELRARMSRHVTETERAATAGAVRRLEARGHRVNLAGWLRGVELTAGRAGLLLAGDLRAAMSCVRAEQRAIANVSADDRRADLLSFCASRAHAELRERFAIATPAHDGTAIMTPPGSMRVAG